MVATSRERISNLAGVLAAMLYLATFLSGSYGVYALTQGASFFESFTFAFPPAFTACVLLFLFSAAFEAVQAVLNKTTGDAKHVAQPYVQH